MENWQKQLQSWSKMPFIKGLSRRYPKAEIFLVGGAVRDLMLNRPTTDFDFVVRNVSKNDLQKFLTKHGKVNLVGKRFGVFKFRAKNWTEEEIDIALPRTEHSLNFTGAYRDFKIKSNAKLKIEDDLSRRDFTINSIAIKITKSYKLKAKSLLVDPFGGLNDLKKKIIRTVGKPELRFKEDYSRMLRAIRFACQLNFKVEPKTWQTLKTKIKNLDKKINGERVIPYEVIAKELNKAIIANPVSAIKLLDESGALKILMPELLKMKKCPQPKIFHNEGDVWTHTLLALEKLNSPAFKKEFFGKKISPEVIWGVIYHDLGKPVTMTKTDRIRFHGHETVSQKEFRKTAERLKLAATGLKVDFAQTIIAKHMLLAQGDVSQMKETTIEKYFFNPLFPGLDLLMLIFADISATIPKSGRADFSSYQKLKKRINNLKKKGRRPTQLPKPLINGHDLIKIFKLKAGPKIGELLSTAREAQLRGKIKSKAEGLNYLKKYL